jgi:sugar lactone lactonase YvrE
VTEQPVRARTLLAEGLGFAEAPRWHDGRLFVSDIAARQVLAFGLDGSREVVCEVAAAPSGLGWLPDGRMLLCSMHDRRVLRLEAGRLVTHADLTAVVTDDLNDMIVSADGNAYVGNFGYTAAPGATPVSTGLVLVRPDGSVERQPGELFRPNGMAITPDGRTLVVAETRVHRLTAFRIDPDGSLRDPRLFAELPRGSWADGICLDSEGCAWVADPKGRRAVRIDESSTILDSVDTAPLPTVACVLGGPRRDLLFLLQAPVRPMEQGRADPQSRIEYLTVPVGGAGRP